MLCPLYSFFYVELEKSLLMQLNTCQIVSNLVKEDLIYYLYLTGLGSINIVRPTTYYACTVDALTIKSITLFQ